ncbi:MAG: TIGR03013 family PEP-CTERM/XrtA system glycosyltransferase [Rhodospirillaceae bacterium]|nr:TIGR03013 family PEP-CTERM/XrtA system glycosyltransferase [Rhodospirillales bacterium]
MAILFSVLHATADILRSLGFDIRADASAALLMTLTAAAGMTSVGLYNREHFVHMRHTIARAVVALPLIVLCIAAVLGGYGWLAGDAPPIPYYLLCAAGLSAFFPLLLMAREIFIRVIDHLGAFRRRVVVIGSGARAAKIDKLSRELKDRSFTVVGFIHLDRGGEQAQDSERRASNRRQDYLVAPENVVDFCISNNVEEVVVAATERRGLPVHQLLACKMHGIRVTEHHSFWERESGQVDLTDIRPSWLLFSDGFSKGFTRAVLKRVFDVVVALVVLLLTLPLTIPTAILIMLESPGPVFYRQERVGLHGRRFMILKFRSMRVDAEKDGPRWAAKNDSRVTRIGAFIRKVRIDEIPQVINVLKGDMSVVGPRPERPVFVESLAQAIPYYNDRHTVKPGITGWAQINYPYGATEEDARMKMAYDLYYVKNHSLFLDNIILLQTVKVLLWNDGAR